MNNRARIRNNPVAKQALESLDTLLNAYRNAKTKHTYTYPL